MCLCLNILVLCTIGVLFSWCICNTNNVKAPIDQARPIPHFWLAVRIFRVKLRSRVMMVGMF